MIMACNKENTFLRARNWYLNAGNRLGGHIFVSFDDKTKKKLKKFWCRFGESNPGLVVGRWKK